MFYVVKALVEMAIGSDDSVEGFSHPQFSFAVHQAVDLCCCISFYRLQDAGQFGVAGEVQQQVDMVGRDACAGSCHGRCRAAALPWVRSGSNILFGLSYPTAGDGYVGMFLYGISVLR